MKFFKNCLKISPGLQDIFRVTFKFQHLLEISSQILKMSLYFHKIFVKISSKFILKSHQDWFYILYILPKYSNSIFQKFITTSTMFSQMFCLHVSLAFLDKFRAVFSKLFQVMPEFSENFREELHNFVKIFHNFYKIS